MLSNVARIFDPLGLKSPIVVKAKILLQELWLLKIGWDEELPPKEAQPWLKIRAQLEQMSVLSIPRWVLNDNVQHVELHGSCDASEKAYGCVIYVRTIDLDGFVKVEILCAKSRVAPLKKMTVPRLEYVELFSLPS